jgi:hypothetical protein
MFRVGSFIVCVCGAMLAIAVVTSLAVDRQLSPVETFLALVAACVLGGAYWAFVLRRMRKGGVDV